MRALKKLLDIAENDEGKHTPAQVRALEAVVRAAVPRITTPRNASPVEQLDEHQPGLDDLFP